MTAAQAITTEPTGQAFRLPDRDLARSSPAGLATVASRGRWQIAPHLALVNRALLQLSRRQITRLLINTPPRHGKSSLVSHYFPAWYLGHFPEHRIILASYEADFAASWGAKARDVLSEWGPRLFAIQVSQASTARDRWDIAQHSGGMQTAGVGGALTGKGANLLLVEDPVKNAEEAASATYRQRMVEWWEAVAYTRLEPDGVAVVIQTRWHADDLAGRLIQQMQDGGEPWTVLNLPAIAEADEDWGFWKRKVGDPLWPERYPLPQLERIRGQLSQYWWSALYQQRPTPRGGGLFERVWFTNHIVESAPRGAVRCRYWDLAATAAQRGSDPDWTVGVKMAAQNGQFWIEDVRRLRGTPLDVEALIAETAQLDGVDVKIVMEREGGSGGKITTDHYARHVLAGYNFHDDPVSQSKTARADPFSAAAEKGNVSLVRGAWNRDFLDEAELFPNGPHDDQIDAASGAHRQLSAPQGRPFSSASAGPRPQYQQVGRR